MAPSPTAAIIVIGNEILSGRTQDKNLHWLAGELNSLGIKLAEAVVIPDIESRIIEAANRCRSHYDYVFTSGGIGPTHDDITTASIAAAFDLPVTTHPQAEAILRDYYKPEDQTAERMKMATTPQGAALIPNAISGAPGFRVENIYVMAGVPSIFKSMFKAISHELTQGDPILSASITVFQREGKIAEFLTQLQNQFPMIEIGSYPFAQSDEIGTRVVFTGTDSSSIQRSKQALCDHLEKESIDFSQDSTS